jgi:hypothetical protein
MRSPLHTILDRPDVWRHSDRPGSESRHGVVPTGHAALDAALHHGGWPRSTLTEILADGCGIGEMQLLAPTLAQCSRGHWRLFFIGAPYLPYAPALHALGVRLERVLVLAPGPRSELLWSLEQVLRSSACGCLLAWLPALRAADYGALRRLQLAANRSHGPVFLFRPAESAHTVSPAALRLRLRIAGDQLELDILKQRGARAGQQLRIERPASLLQPRITPGLLPSVVHEMSNETANGPRDTPYPPPRSSLLPVATMH